MSLDVGTHPPQRRGGREFVGRSRELVALTHALSHRPAIVLVEGEAGVGKSSLVQAFLAATRGTRSLVGICPPLARPFTLGPLVDAVRHTTETVAGLPLTALAGTLRPLFPEWSAVLPPAPEPLDDSAAARHRLFRPLAELIGCLEVSLLVIEDVHWADEATVDFLSFLIAHQVRTGLGLLLTYRPEDLPNDSLLLRLSSRTPAGIRHVRLTLEPFVATRTAEELPLSLEEIDDDRPRRQGRRGYGNQLSPREIEVVRLVMAGRTNREIGVVLNRSPKTVATQVASAMRKLKVSSRTALAMRALDAGLVARTDR